MEKDLKQIIIDGVDVSECNYFNNTDKSYCEECCSEFGCAICNDRPNCYYKQLKRKEQECNKLKQTLAEIKELTEPYKRNIDKICGHCRRYDVCHACCIDDINCYQYKKPTTPACDRYCELKEFEINNMSNHVLQKISEVKNEN